MIGLVPCVRCNGRGYVWSSRVGLAAMRARVCPGCSVVVVADDPAALWRFTTPARCARCGVRPRVDGRLDCAVCAPVVPEVSIHPGLCGADDLQGRPMVGADGG